jgi:preprotein translocase subunit SecD
MLIGGIIVVVFIGIYYKGAGIIANVALLLNILLIAAGLAAFQATLTLPGIAGIILTIGMAVDANVIIFERIREEVRLGKTPRAAVDGGYARATMTILDANITTLIAALVLFQFGTGPVKGFAVTLSIGILASLFTAIIVARVIFDYLVLQRRTQRLSI